MQLKATLGVHGRVALKIEYDLAPEDWGEFAIFWASDSPSIKRSILTTRLLVSATLVLVCLTKDSPHRVLWALGGVLSAVAWWGIAPSLVNESLRRKAENRYRPCLRGRHMLEIVDTGIRAKCEVSESLYKWAGIRRVVSTPTHVFVMIGDSLGYTVPRARMVEGDLDVFVKNAREHLSTDAQPAH